MGKETFTVGFTTNKALMLDLDRFTYAEALDLAVKTTNKFQLEGFLIAKSSELNYHVIFNKFMDWDDVLEILFKIVWGYHYYGHGEHPHLTNWAILQVIKQSITLRIGTKVLTNVKKPKPKVVICKGKTGQNIKEYLDICKAFSQKHKTKPQKHNL